MRRAFAEATTELLDRDPRLVCLLGDIGVWGFRHAAESHPTRVINIGILEQTMVGVGAGLSMSGYIPILHTIAPFLVERALEQIKVDFAYQELGGNLVTVGASYDYSALGATHHCPGDAGILLNVPNAEIFVPGTADEFKSLFMASYDNGRLSYFRLSEFSNSESHPAVPGEPVLVRTGTQGSVVIVGPVFDTVMPVIDGLDVRVVYLSSLNPVDSALMSEYLNVPRVLIVEPFYEGTTALALSGRFPSRESVIRSVGFRREFARQYGSPGEQMRFMGLSSERLRIEVERMFR